MNIRLICQMCDKEFFESRPSHVRIRKYCSVPCRIQWMRDNFIPFNKGKTKREFPKLSNSGVYKGAVPWNKGKKVLKMSGENHPRWIKDRSLVKRQFERNNPEYKQWRAQVWSRDNWKCKISNNDCSGRIEAHHILAWKDYPELRYQINNGITLCHAHHPKKRSEEKRLSPYFRDLVSVSN